jgi:hypothetical protein
MSKIFQKPSDNGIDLGTLREQSRVSGWGLLFSLAVSIGLWFLAVWAFLYFVRR